MALATKQETLLDPADICLLRPDTRMPHSDGPPDLVNQHRAYPNQLVKWP